MSYPDLNKMHDYTDEAKDVCMYFSDQNSK